MEPRTTATLHYLAPAMRATQTTELQYLIQRTTPEFLKDMDRAHGLREMF